MTENAHAEQATSTEFALQRIYVKDISFEAPNLPSIFNEPWEPESGLNLNSSISQVDENQYEVVLSVTVTTKIKEKVAYLVEVQQAGIFHVSGFSEEDMGPMMGAYCPNILFPYAREVISDMVSKASFPQLLLSPVNFDALYAQHVQNTQSQQGESAMQDTAH